MSNSIFNFKKTENMETSEVLRSAAEKLCDDTLCTELNCSDPEFSFNGDFTLVWSVNSFSGCDNMTVVIVKVNAEVLPAASCDNPTHVLGEFVVVIEVQYD